MKKQLFLGHTITLFVGGLIYVSFRNETLKMFSWFEAISISEIVSNYRLLTLPLKQYLPDWFLYSLPDGLWLFSYISIILLLWGNTISKKNILWFSLIPAIAISSEIAQVFSLVPGTFDLFDLLFYVLGTLVPFLIFRNSQTIKIIKT